jgi:hypothetical protein
MSAFADVIDTFRLFQSQYGWTQDETARNYLRVVNDIGWELSDIEINCDDDCQQRELDEYEIARNTFHARNG